MAEAGLLGPSARRPPAAAPADRRWRRRPRQLPREGEAGHPPVHERRAVAGRHVRPQADAREVRTARRCRRRTCRTERKTGAAFGSPFKFQKYGQSGIEVSEIFSERRRVHRRHLRDPLDARRRAQSRAVADADELRRRPAGPARAWARGSLYGLGTENQNLPGFVVHVPRRLPDRRVAELAVGVPARRLPGDVHRHQAHATIEKLIENIRNRRSSTRRPAAAARPAARS